MHHHTDSEYKHKTEDLLNGPGLIVLCSYPGNSAFRGESIQQFNFVTSEHRSTLYVEQEADSNDCTSRTNTCVNKI